MLIQTGQGAVILPLDLPGQTYKYGTSGALAKVYDSETGTTSTYYYDFTDRMMKYVEKSSTGTHSVGYTYDSLNNLTALAETFGTTERKISYAYDGDNRPTSITAGNSALSYGYDAYGRVSTLTTKHDGNAFATKTYAYKLNANGAPTGQVSGVTIKIGSNSKTYTYTYDKNGNITGISDGTYATTYAYDSANQLIREDNQEAGTTTLWTYDNAGNILTRTVHPYNNITADNGAQTKYLYYSEWGDQLKVYNSRIIHYDEIGNPLSDYIWDYSWQHSRQLASMIRLGTSEMWEFTYNADGLRTQRTNGTRTYQYTYNGDKLTHMTVDGHTMYFTYDASGTPLNIVYDGLKFYYVTNLQGDVISIVDGNGTEFVHYTYDAWGKILSVEGSATNLRYYNPLRYRGYVYDPETELYYLQSRYYNPEMGRFINADGFTSTGQGVLGNNMFAYCGNNPVIRADSTGCGWLAIVGAMALGAAVNVGVSFLVSWSMGETMTGWDIGISAFSGALGAFGPGGAAIGGLISGVYEGRKTYQNTGSMGASLVSGAASFVATFMTVGTMSDLAELGIDAGIKTFADAVFGAGSGFVSAGVGKVASSLVTPNKPAKKSLSTGDIIAKLRNTGDTRIWNGQIYKVGKNCSMPGYMLDGEVRIYCHVRFWWEDI